VNNKSLNYLFNDVNNVNKIKTISLENIDDVKLIDSSINSINISTTYIIIYKF